MSEGKKHLSFLTIISTVICVVFVCEAAAPAAAIGNQQFFWWIFDWVRDGLGDKWGARISYYYWVNYPLWIASLAVMFPDILGMVFHVEFSMVAKIAIDLAFVWIVYLMGRSKAADSEIVLNGGALIKVCVAVLVGAMGIWYAMENGFANDMSAGTFLPELTNTNALSYISIIIFNFMGFEVICTMTDDMKDPAVEIPKAIVMGGLAIAVIYLFAGFGIGAAVPAADIDPDYGMIYAVQTMVGDSPLFKIICIAFLITLFANMAAWSFGVNSVARYAAEHGNMPKVFASMISKDDMLTYIPMFPAFLNLRKNDPNRERIFTFPFKGAMMKVALIVPAAELVIAIVATICPLSAAEMGEKLPMFGMFVLLVVVGEIVRVVSAKGRTEEYKGLTPELAAERLAEEAKDAE